MSSMLNGLGIFPIITDYTAAEFPRFCSNGATSLTDRYEKLGEDNLNPDTLGEDLHQRTITCNNPTMGNEYLYVTVLTKYGEVFDIPIVKEAHSLKVNFKDPKHYVSYQPAFGTRNFLSRDQVIAIVKQAVDKQDADATARMNQRKPNDQR